MAGLYIHIPFCKKLCSYCDFFKTTAKSRIPAYLKSLAREFEQRGTYLDGEALETIYIGGGTPSVLHMAELREIFSWIERYFILVPDCEITLEANPDDLSRDYLGFLCELTPVNRLSIGIQSFHDNDLAMLNRRHTAEQAKQCVVNARQAGYQNISLDLIYGLPGMSKDNWLKNLQIAFGLGVQHISAYHLTIEPQTSLFRKVNRGLLQLPAEEESRDQFFVMHTLAAEHEFLHYEISNLAKQGYISKHNTNYWRRKKYLGLGPSAHSFNLVSRQWNVSHVVKYIEALINGHPYFVSEELDDKTRFNEHLMLSLRTCWGVGISEIRQEYGERMASAFESQLESLLQTDWIVRRGDTIILTPSGWMVSDYIVSRLLL